MNDINTITINYSNYKNQIQLSRAHLLVPTEAHLTREVRGATDHP